MFRASLTKLCKGLSHHSLQKSKSPLFSALFTNPTPSSYLSLSNNIPTFNFSNTTFPGESEEKAAQRRQIGEDEEWKTLQEIKQNPKDFQAYCYLGDVYRFLFRNNKDAIDSYLKAIEIKPLYWKAYECLLALDAELTIKKLEEIFNKNPHYYAEYHIGLALYNLLRHEEAMEKFNKAIEMNPRFTAAYAHRAIIFEEEKKFDEAVKQYENIIGLGEKKDEVALLKMPHAYHHWSIVLGQQGKYEEAIKKVELAVEKLCEQPEFVDSKEYLLKRADEIKKSGKSQEEIFKNLEAVFAEVIYEGFDVQGLDYSYLTEVFPEEIKEN